MELAFGTYNLEEGGLDGGDDSRLRRQLAMLSEVQADVWALQECSFWDTNGAQQIAEEALGMRGYIAQSTRSPGGNLGVFVRESAGITVTGTRHEGLLNEERSVPYWHGVAVVDAQIEGYGPVRFASAHLAPSAPTIRLAEAEAFQLIAEKQPPLIAGGDWNSFPSYWPVPDLTGHHEGKTRRKKDTRARDALEEWMTDVARHLKVNVPTVGHRSSDSLAYPCDAAYTTLDPSRIVSWEVLQEDNPLSDHRPAVATFTLHP